MGTSTSNRGQNGKTPLVPSWLDDNLGDIFKPFNPPLITGLPQMPNIIPETHNPNVDTLVNPTDPQQQPPKPQTTPEQPDPKRFSAPRGNFTRYVNGGSRSKLGRAASSYVKKSAGGSQNATKRLGSARASTARLFSVVGGFASNGVQATANRLRLGDIIGKTATDVFISIMSFVCPDGGNTDEGIARSAYIEALATMPDWENKQIETLTPDEFIVFTKTYMTTVIEQRIVNDIGNKLFALPEEVAQVENLQEQMKDFIGGAVSDSVSKLNVDIKKIDSSQVQNIVDSVYKTAFDIMASLEE